MKIGLYQDIIRF